jgi:hypothetical protein
MYFWGVRLFRSQDIPESAGHEALRTESIPAFDSSLTSMRRTTSEMDILRQFKGAEGKRSVIQTTKLRHEIATRRAHWHERTAERASGG